MAEKKSNAAAAPSSRTSRNIIFVHPDLGIGGAERLVIDAAVGLQAVGHKVTVLTSHCDPEHCFEEARDGTLDVRVRGNAIFPPSFGGRLAILCAILRQLSLVLSCAVFSSELKQLQPDVFFVDQLSVCVPFLRLLCPRAKVLFYGHFPDRLLARQESGALGFAKRLYRLPFDGIESWSTGCADSIVVNSKFTRAVFKHAFTTTRARDLKVIYPCVDTDMDDAASEATLWPDKKVYLSINRFEGKKNLSLAIKAYSGLSPDERSKSRLVIAGGFDPRVVENTNTLEDLQALATSLELTYSTLRGSDPTIPQNTTEILFLLSVPSSLKTQLLHSTALLLYTPTNEHFGIVPLEAMLASVPVLATNTGGPLETIYDGRTGWLRSPEKIEQWTAVMRKPLIPSSADALASMGARGRERVLREFSHTKMTEELDTEVSRMLASDAKRPKVMPVAAEAAVFATMVALVGGGIALLLTNFLIGVELKRQGGPEVRNGAGATVTGGNEL